MIYRHNTRHGLIVRNVSREMMIIFQIRVCQNTLMLGM